MRDAQSLQFGYLGLVDVDLAVLVERDEATIIGAVMQGTQGDPVGRLVSAGRVGDWNDMRRFDELKLYPTHRTAMLVSFQNVLLKIRVTDSSAHRGERVLTLLRSALRYVRIVDAGWIGAYLLDEPKELLR